MRYLVVFLLCASAMAQQHKISVQKYEVPLYPPIARVAHVDGDVAVTFTLRPDGQPANPRAVSGPPMLMEHALNTIKEWKFHCDDCSWNESVTHTVIVGYRLEENMPCDFLYVVYHFEFPNRVTVHRDRLCPIIDTVTVSRRINR